MSKNTLYFFFIVALLALLLGLWTHHGLHQGEITYPKRLKQTLLLPEVRALPFFQLTDTQQQDFTNARLKNAWSLVYFGSTHCAQHCTETLTTLNQISQQLANKPENILQIIFISTDPQDSPQKVQTYLEKFNKNFIGVTGSATEIKNFTQALNDLYLKASPTLPPENFSMEHSDTILIINPVGKWIGVFNAPLNAEIVSADMLQLMQ